MPIEKDNEDDYMIGMDFVEKYRDSLSMEFHREINPIDNHKSEMVITYLMQYLTKEYGLKYPFKAHNLIEKNSLFEMTYDIIQEWEPDIEYNCPIALFTDISFDPSIKKQYMLKFSEHNLIYFNGVYELQRQIELFRMCLELASFNNNLFYEKINSHSMDWEYDFLDKDYFKLDLLSYANFGVKYDYKRKAYPYLVDEDNSKSHLEKVNLFRELQPLNYYEMEPSILEDVKNFLNMYPRIKHYMDDDYDAGFIFYNKTYNSSDFVDPLLNSGMYYDYPMINISLGCSSIALVSEKNDEAPTSLLLESGSILFFSKVALKFRRRMLKPYAKSFNLLQRKLQESIRMHENSEFYEKEVEKYYDLSPEDKEIVEIMRKSRIDLQLRVTRKKWDALEEIEMKDDVINN